WDAVLAMTGQVSLEGDKTANLRTLAEELTQYATGMKALENGDVAAAQAASDQLDAGLWRLQQRKEAEDAGSEKCKADTKDAKKDEPPMVAVMPDALGEPLLKSMNIESLELRAGILVAKGKLDDAKKLYADAKYEEKKLGYHEP